MRVWDKYKGYGTDMRGIVQIGMRGMGQIYITPHEWRHSQRAYNTLKGVISIPMFKQCSSRAY